MVFGTTNNKGARGKAYINRGFSPESKKIIKLCRMKMFRGYIIDLPQNSYFLFARKIKPDAAETTSGFIF